VGQAPETRPHGGEMLDAISNELVALHRRQFGRGPSDTKTFLLDGMVVCVMHDVFLPAERTLVQAGDLDCVRDTRLRHKEAVKAELEAAVAKITEREVLGSAMTVHAEPEVVVEMFFLGAPTDADRDA
jgi:uncharacterized protein YbcI